MPWSRCGAGGRPCGSLPVIPYNSDQFPSSNVSSATAFGEDLPSSLDQFHPLKNVHITDLIDGELLQTDPFFLLSTLLSTAALSWSQLLNYLEEDIKDCQRSGPTQFKYALEQLRFNAGLINRIEGFLIENTHIIQGGGYRSWPKAKSSEAQQRKLQIQKALESDHVHLAEKCTRLAKECEIGSSILVSSAQLLESQKGIDQAAQVQSLTKLAFFFIPMGFVASLFGMNVAELKDDGPHLWVFFVIALPLSLFFSLMASWHEYFIPIFSKVKIWSFHALQKRNRSPYVYDSSITNNSIE